MTRLGIAGAGAWGTALANVAASAGLAVRLWARDPAQAAELAETRLNPRALPGIPLHPGIVPTSELNDLADSEAVLLVTPAQSTRAMATALAGVMRTGAPLILCAKGLERGTRLPLSDVAADARPLAADAREQRGLPDQTSRPGEMCSRRTIISGIERNQPTAHDIAAIGPVSFPEERIPGPQWPAVGRKGHEAEGIAVEEIEQRCRRQDRDVVVMQQEGLRNDPPLMLINDADMQAKWYYQLKAEYAKAQAEGRPFTNPVTERVLRWRS